MKIKRQRKIKDEDRLAFLEIALRFPELSVAQIKKLIRNAFRGMYGR